MPAAALRRALVVTLASAAPLWTAACDGGPDPARSPSGAPSLEADVQAFQTFSGLTVPTSATDVTVQVVQDPSGAPAYRVDVVLATAQVDACCTGGGLPVPYTVVRVPPYIASQLGYTGPESPDGVRLSEGGTAASPSRRRVVFATGTKTATAAIDTDSFQQPR